MADIPACGLEFTCIAPHVEIANVGLDYALIAPHIQLPQLSLDYALLVPWRADPPSIGLEFELYPPVFIGAIGLEFQLYPPIQTIPIITLNYHVKPLYAFVRPENAATLPRVMRCYLVADGYDNLELAISSMSSRMSYGRQSFINVVVPDVIDLVDDIELRA